MFTQYIMWDLMEQCWNIILSVAWLVDPVFSVHCYSQTEKLLAHKMKISYRASNVSDFFFVRLLCAGFCLKNQEGQQNKVPIQYTYISGRNICRISFNKV